MSQNFSALVQALIPKNWFSGSSGTKQIGNINVDANGSIVASGQGGQANALYVSSTTVLKPGPGMVCQVNVLVAGSGTGSINDCTATANAVTATEIAVLPQTVGPILLQFPALTGITVKPGSGQIVSVSWQ